MPIPPAQSRKNFLRDWMAEKSIGDIAYSFVMNSSRLSSTEPRFTQAAISDRGDARQFGGRELRGGLGILFIDHPHLRQALPRIV